MGIMIRDWMMSERMDMRARERLPQRQFEVLCTSYLRCSARQYIAESCMAPKLISLSLPDSHCPPGCDLSHSARSMKLPSVTIRSPAVKPSSTG